jgi:hypothetical protein
MNIKENKIAAYIKENVVKQGGEYRRVSWQGRRDAPDILIWIPGWTVGKFVETKRVYKNLRDSQAREFERLRKMGFECLMINNLFDAADLLGLSK